MGTRKSSPAGEGLTGLQTELHGSGSGSRSALSRQQAWPRCQPGADKLTAASGPAALPSPTVCKDKRDADSPTPGQAGGHWERQLTPQPSRPPLLGNAPKGLTQAWTSARPGRGEAVRL